MMATDAGGKARKEAMGKASGTDLAGFEAQLATTRLFDKPADAVAFTQEPGAAEDDGPRPQIPVRQGLLGKGAK